MSTLPTTLLSIGALIAIGCGPPHEETGTNAESGLRGYAELTPTEAPAPAFRDVRALVGCEELTATWGVSWHDVERDGDPDLWLSHHMHYASALLENDRGLSFRPASPELGRATGLDDHFSGWADLDGDGDGDVYTTCGFHRPDSLLMNEGDGGFHDTTTAAGITFGEEGRGRAVIFADLDGDARLDLLVLNDDTPDFFYRGEGDGTFVERTREAGLENIFRKRGAVAADLDNDGDLDLYVPLRRHDQRNMLLRNRGDGTFAERAAGSGTDLVGGSLAAAAGDVDGDGYLDLYVARRSPMPDVLLRNLTAGRFEDVTERAGIEMRGGESRDVGFADFDNDGALDVFVVDGGSADDGDRADALWWNAGDGTFTDVSGAAGTRGPASASGSSAAFADYDRDGFVDVAVSHGAGARGLQGPLRLFRNQGGDRHWLQAELDGGPGNRDGYGARVVVRRPDGRRIMRENGVFRNLSQDEATLHVGLGPDTFATDVAVAWPDGRTTRVQGVPADRVVSIPRDPRGRTLASHPAALMGVVPGPDLVAVWDRLARRSEGATMTSEAAETADEAIRRAEIAARGEELLAHVLTHELAATIAVPPDRLAAAVDATRERLRLPARTWIEHVAVGRFTEYHPSAVPAEPEFDRARATTALESLRAGRSASHAVGELSLRGWSTVYGEEAESHTGYAEAGWMTERMLAARFGDEHADQILALEPDESYGPFPARDHPDIQDPALVHDILHVVRRGATEAGGVVPAAWIEADVSRDLRRDHLRRLLAETGDPTTDDDPHRRGFVDSIPYSIPALARAAVARGIDRRPEVLAALDRIATEVRLDLEIRRRIAAIVPTEDELHAHIEARLVAWFHFRKIDGTILYFKDRSAAEAARAALSSGRRLDDVVSESEIPNLRIRKARGGESYFEEIELDQPTWHRLFGYQNLDVLKELVPGEPTRIMERDGTYRFLLTERIRPGHRFDEDDARRVARRELIRERTEALVREILFGE